MTDAGFEVLSYPEGDSFPTNIAFKRLPPPKPQPSDEETRFARQIELAVRRLNELMRSSVPNFKMNERYQSYLRIFYYAAQNGVQHGAGNLVQGTAALESAKEYFVSNEGPLLRRAFLRRLHVATAVFFIVAFVLLLVLEFGTVSVTLLGRDWHANLQALAVAALGIGYDIQ